MKFFKVLVCYMQKSVKIFSNTNFNLLVNDKPGSRVKNYTYIYLINVYHALTYISLIYMKFFKVLVCYMKYYQKIDK